MQQHENLQCWDNERNELEISHISLNDQILVIFLDNIIYHFTSFPQSPRSSKSEFRVKSYDEKMKKLPV